MLDENAKSHPMLRPYKTFSEKVTLLRSGLNTGTLFIFNPLLSVSQDKEIYRWPIKESTKAMLAWEWTLDKARDGEVEVEKKAATRKISQTAQVKERSETFTRY